MGRRADVAVVGLGAMGSAAAAHLARRGRRVVGFEQFEAVHDRGSSHGGSRIIRQAYFEDPAYVPLVLRAYELWRDVARAAGRDTMVETTGALMIGPPAGELVAGSLRSARQWGLDHELLDAGELRRRFPAFAPTPETVAVHEPRAGVLNPEAAVAALLGMASDAGAELHFSAPVLGWEADPAGRGVTVTSTAGAVRADQLVVCPGAWAPQLLGDVGVPFAVERRVQFWFRPGGARPERFGPGHLPVWIWDDGGDLPYGLPAVGRPEVKIAWHHRGGRGTADDLDRTVSPAEVDEIAAAVRRLVPDMPGSFVAASACLYTLTPDQHFVIGRHPRHPAVVVVSACSGHGFKFAPVIGEIVADLVTAGATAHPIGLFEPGRF